MAASLSISLEVGEIESVIQRFVDQLPSLPLDARQRLVDEIASPAHLHFLKLSVLPATAAAGATDGVSRLGIIGLEELLASALRTINNDLGFFHGGSPEVVE